MQYRGAKRIKRIAAVVLSAALLITELPQSGIVYAAQTEDTGTDSPETEMAMEQDESEEASQAQQEETISAEPTSPQTPETEVSNTEPASPEVTETDTESSSTESSGTESPETVYCEMF